MSNPRFEGAPERLLGFLDKLIDYEQEFLQTLEGLRAWLLASLADTASPQEMEEELLRLQERFREFLRARGLEGVAPPPQIPDGGPEA